MYFVITLLIFSIAALAMTFIKPSIPDVDCRFCGEVYKGRYALDMADSCESTHLMEIHGKL